MGLSAFLAVLSVVVAIVADPIGKVSSWVPLKRTSTSQGLSRPSSLLEVQWGLPYVSVPGMSNGDGTVLFGFSNAIDGEVSGGGHGNEDTDHEKEDASSAQEGNKSPGDESGGAGGSSGEQGGGSGEQGGDAGGEGGESEEGKNDNGEASQPDEASASQASCSAVQVNTDRFGSEVFQTITNISSTEKCQEACASTMKCNAAFFDKNNSTCDLLRRLRLSTNGQQTTVVLPNCDDKCFLKGQQLSGNGTLLGNTENSQICQALCQGDSGCKGFTWLASSRACSSFSNDSDHAPNGDAVSGPKTSCTPNTKPRDYAGTCLQRDLTGSWGSNVESHRAENDDECHEMCLKNAACHWFTYNVHTKTCFLKPSRGKVEFSAGGDFTGPKLCDSSCYTKNIALQGTAIASSKTHDPYDCHYECYMNEDCRSWSFNVNSTQCDLYDILLGPLGQHAEGSWSGTRGGCGSEAEYTPAPDKAG